MIHIRRTSHQKYFKNMSNDRQSLNEKKNLNECFISFLSQITYRLNLH